MSQPATLLSESQFQRQVTDLAELYGWEWMHIRPAVNLRGQWRTAISGTIGKGWPDLVLVRPRDRKIIFAEVKAGRGTLTDAQRHVLDVLGCVESAQVVIWRPSDWPTIVELLQRGIGERTR